MRSSWTYYRDVYLCTYNNVTHYTWSVIRVSKPLHLCWCYCSSLSFPCPSPHLLPLTEVTAGWVRPGGASKEGPWLVLLLVWVFCCPWASSVWLHPPAPPSPAWTVWMSCGPPPAMSSSHTAMYTMSACHHFSWRLKCIIMQKTACETWRERDT